MNRPIVYCADVIARADDKRFIIVQRLSSISGLSLPGGKQEKDEILSETAKREFYEETGFSILENMSVLLTRAEENRDPRGSYVSTVFIAENVYGEPKDEPNKTNVLFLTREEIFVRKDDFVFDHFSILEKYFQLFDVGRVP